MTKFKYYMARVTKMATVLAVSASALFFCNYSSAMDTEKLVTQGARLFKYEQFDDYPTILISGNYELFKKNYKIAKKPFHILLWMYNRHYGIFLEKLYGENYSRLTDDDCIDNLVNTYPESILDIMYLCKNGIVTEETYNKDVMPVVGEFLNTFDDWALTAPQIRLLAALCRNCKDLEFFQIALFKLVAFPVDVFSIDGLTSDATKDAIIYDKFKEFQESPFMDIVMRDSHDNYLFNMAESITDISFSIFYSTRLAFIPNLSRNPINPLELAALSGSVNCFKYFLLNKIPITSDVLFYSLVGGDNDIVRLCSNCSLDTIDITSSKIIAISNLRLFDWVIDYFRVISEEQSPIYIERTGNTLYVSIIERLQAFVNRIFDERSILNGSLHVNFVKLLVDSDVHSVHAIRCAMEKHRPDLRNFFVEEMKVDLSEAAYYAVKFGTIEDLDYVMSHGATINKNQRLLRLSLERKQVEMFEYLLRIGISINSERSLFELAEDAEMFEYLLSKGLDITSSSNIITHAVFKKNIKLLTYLVDKMPKGSINSFDNNGWSPINIVLDRLDFDETYVEVAESVINLGADVNLCSGSEYDTPLHRAIKQNRVSSVKFLVAHGSDINMHDKYMSLSPLHIAADKEFYSEEILRYLIANKANVNDITGRNNATPIWFAAISGNADGILILIENGADVNATSDGTGRNSPLHVAARKGHYEAVVALVEHGADINARNCDNETPEMVTKNEQIKEFLRSKMQK